MSFDFHKYQKIRRKKSIHFAESFVAASLKGQNFHLFRRSREAAEPALIRWKKLTKGGQNSVIRPSVHQESPTLTLDGELPEYLRIEVYYQRNLIKGTSEPCFERKSEFRASEGVVNDNVVILCLDMCSDRLREHFCHLLQARLCLWCSLKHLSDSSRKCPRRTSSKIVI